MIAAPSNEAIKVAKPATNAHAKNGSVNSLILPVVEKNLFYTSYPAAKITLMDITSSKVLRTRLRIAKGFLDLVVVTAIVFKLLFKYVATCFRLQPTH